MTIIIGGGIAGSYISLKLAERAERDEKVQSYKTKITLYEQNKLLSGNPYVHLHRFGMLYPELTLEEENEFIEDGELFLDEFKDCVIEKPTVVIYRPPYLPQNLVKKCQRIAEKVGKTFYQVYEKEDINFERKCLKKGEKGECLKCCCVESVSIHDRFVNEMLKYFNLDYLTFPFVSCFEYLIDQEKVKEKLMVQILKSPNIEIEYKKFDFSKLGEIERNEIYDCTNNGPQKEHKGVFKFELPQLNLEKFPEIALIGKRGSDKPLIQITPINNQFHIHILNNKATLIEENFFSNSWWSYFNYFLGNRNNEMENNLNTQSRQNFVQKEVRKILPIFEKANFLEFYHGYQSFVDEKRTSSILEVKNFKKVVLVKAFSIVGLFKRNF